MKPAGNDKLRPVAAAWVLLWLLLFTVACSSDEPPPEPAAKDQEGFTFFDVGPASRYSEALREQLSERLGPGAIETRSLINLEVVKDGFLQRHFPELAELNARLNFPPGERVDHDTYKLMYRYAASRRNLPFDLVEIVFSGHNRRPLYIYIRSRKNLTEVLDSLEQKYGAPRRVESRNTNARAIYWRDDDDLFLTAFVPTRRGEEVRMMIYYFDHLEQLAALEEEQRRAEQERRDRAGKRAF